MKTQTRGPLAQMWEDVKALSDPMYAVRAKMAEFVYSADGKTFTIPKPPRYNSGKS